MTPRVLVTETLARSGLELLRKACDVTVRLNPSSDELAQIIGDYQGLIVRSSTQVTEAVLAAGSQLVVVGRAGTGVDNIDLEAATRHGIIVVNAPTGNTVAVAEHTMALMLALARHVCDANVGMHAGRWDKKRLMGSELRGKTLGLVGLGRVGAAVAARARAFDMQVIAYDPFVSPERAQQLDVQLVGLEQLLSQADYVSLHAPLTERTQGMIGARELALMKPSAYLVNCARGDLLNEDALAQALQAGTVAGAALDVFTQEPDVNPILRACPHCLLSPHLGASTEEAQTGAAEEVVQQVVDVLEGRSARYPVNIAALPPEEAAFLAPYLDLARRMGRFYAQFAENHLSRVEVTYAGEVATHDLSLLTAAALAGVLSEVDEPVNLVNAPLIARERGVVVNEVRTSETLDFADLITLRVCAAGGEHLLSGTVMRGKPHILRIDDYWFDFAPVGQLLVSEHIEQPGIIGNMGMLLGEAGVNISFVQVGRQARGGYGMMVLGVDDPLSRETLDRIKTLPSVRAIWLIRL